MKRIRRESDGTVVNESDWNGQDSWVAGLLANIGRELTRSIAELPEKGLPNSAQATYSYKGVRTEVQIEFIKEQ